MSGDINRLGKRDITHLSTVENNMLFIKPARGRRSSVASALLCFTCGLCVILSLLCSILASAVVVLGHKVEGFESRRSTSEYLYCSYLINNNLRYLKLLGLLRRQ